MAPVLAVGAIGWWASRRPSVEKPHLTFHIAKPTALEAFNGFDGAFVVEYQNPQGEKYAFRHSAPFLELKTKDGVSTSHWNHGASGVWKGVWGYNLNGSRLTFRSRRLPPGALHFGYDGFVQPYLISAATPVKPLRVSGKWLVDRTQIKAQNLAVMPHQPLVTLRSVTVTRKMPSGNLTGEAIFQIDGAAMGGNTSFAHDFNVVGQGTMNFSGSGTTPETLHTRVREWNVSERTYSPSASKIGISGRVSADNRWPLGFEIEPFDFKSVKVGQKLRFKQFPVALPKP